MDWLSRIASWLGEHEATISAVVGIAVFARSLCAESFGDSESW